MTGRTFALILALGAVAALTGPVAAQAAGGTIVRLDGNADVERNGKHIPIGESFAVYSGDVLNIGAASNAQIRFEDDSIFVLPGPGKFRIDEFAMPGARGGGKALFTLVDGSLRTITGSVKGTKGQYEMRTDEGTITVQGSSYSAIRCSGSCSKKHPAGLYVRGESGIITLTGTGGALKLKAGQIAFIPSGGGVPVYVKVSPFGDPEIAGTFGTSTEFNVEVHPPRIEREAAASPS